MKVNKRTVFAVAYIVCALVAYTLFIKYSQSKYEEEYAILEAEWIAKGYDPRWMEYWFFPSVWGRNVIWVGIALIYGGLIGAFVLMTISGVLNKRKNT